MKILEKLRLRRPVVTEDSIVPGTEVIELADGGTGYLIPTQTEEAPSRKVFGRIEDSEGRPWEVSAAANAVFLYNVEDNEYVFFDLLGANEFAELLDDAITHAHLN